jgi:anaerobic selenocysteine-containing dehydrogenase
MAEDIRWVKTHCARMDHGGCTLQVGIQDNKIVKIKGDPTGFLSKGYTCIKGLTSADKLNHPDRLRYPLKRVGGRGEGKWERIPWDEALKTVAEGLLKVKEQYGAKGVAFGVGMPKGLDHFIQIRLANLFGSPNIIASQDVCHAPREITGVHTCGFYPVADLHHASKLVVLWGSNITSTNEEGEICSMLMKQIKDGTEIIVIDPRRIDLAKKAKHWLQLRPGTDAALALGFLNVIIEEGLYDKEFVEKWTHGFDELAAHVKAWSPEKVSEISWVPADLIRQAARSYAAAKPAVIQWGNPIEHNTQTFETTRALICLMAITGNLDIPGGNVDPRDPKMLGLAPLVRADLIPDKRKEMIGNAHGIIPRLMTNAPAFFRKAILEDVPYPVRGAYMMCCNPMLSYADSRLTYEAFMKLDFLAVAEVFMTPTAAMADVVLPAATQFEFNDIGHIGIGHGYILARPKVVEPPDECWPDIKIMNELGKLMTPKELWKEDFNEFAEDVVKPAGLTYAQFCEKGYLKGPERFKKYEEKGFSTPTTKVELRLSTAEKFKLSPLPVYKGLPEAEDAAYPLVLTSAKSRYFLHSSYRWIEKLRKLNPDPRLEIHPETAGKYNIKEGDPVLIETPYGKITQVAYFTEALDPRVLCAAHGWWFPEGSPETQYDWQKSNFNMLTSVGKLGKEYGTPNLKGLPCRVSKA